MHTLPAANPLRGAATRMGKKFKRFYLSPFYQIADALKAVSVDSLETINPFILAPWKRRIQTIIDETATELEQKCTAVCIAVSSSARNGVVGIGGAIEIQTSFKADETTTTFSSTLGLQNEHNAYSGELTAMATALSRLPMLRYREIVLLTRNKSSVLTIRKPRQQSGQEQVCRFYKITRELRLEGNMLKVEWLLLCKGDNLLKRRQRPDKA